MNNNERKAEEADAVLGEGFDALLDDEALLDGVRAAFTQPAGHAKSRSDILPDQIAGYRILRELGRGGMGVVYEAEQNTPKRRVALKVARDGLHPRLSTRFEHETQLLGRLKHSAIAEIYEAGSCEVAGLGHVSFFAMALVERASPITEFAQQRALKLSERLALFLQLLAGVEHGHLRGIVHRDLKPSNLLVDESGQVKIIDFGLARSTALDEDLVSMHTRSGELLGTPHYMSPEQWTDPTIAGVSADLYSLGVILFELLCGRLPFNLEGKSLLEIGEMVRSARPRRLDLVSLGARSDLNIIVQKLLEKDPEHRYTSVSALIADLQRFLDHKPIEARPPSTLYQLRKFARRNRTLVGGVAAVLLVLILGTIVSLYFAMTASRRSEELAKKLYAARSVRAFAAYDQGAIEQVEHFVRQAPANDRAWESRRLRGFVADRSILTWRDKMLARPQGPLTRPGRRVAVTRDGGRVLTGGDDGRLRIWDTTTGQLRRCLGQEGERIMAVAWSPDGQRIASGDRVGIVRLRDAVSGKEVGRFDMATSPKPLQI